VGVLPGVAMRRASLDRVHRTSLYSLMPRRGGRKNSGLYGAKGACKTAHRARR
jgi:hypothetical protein